MHAVWSQEPVLNALPQAVLIDRIAKVVVRIAIIFAERRGRHAKLKR